MSDLQYIRVEWDHELAIVVIDRADKLNALNAEVLCEIGDVFHDLREDDDVQGVILTGAGEKAFVGVPSGDYEERPDRGPHGLGVHLPGPEFGTSGRRELRIRTVWTTRFHGRHERGTDGLSREAKGRLQGRMR